MSKQYCFVILVVTLLLGVLIPVRAVDLGISPPDINLRLERGQEYHGEIYLYGSETENVGVNISLMDWSLTSKGDYIFLPAKVLERSVIPWISVEPMSLSLPPQRGQKIRYTIKVPLNANGSYWGAVMFETNPVLQKGGNPQIVISGRLAYIIRIEIQDSPSGIGSIESYHLSWNGDTQKIEASIRVKNEGISFIRMHCKLKLSDSLGRTVREIPFKEGYVLPGFSREFNLIDNDLKLTPGYYIGLAIIDFGESKLKAVQNSVQVAK